MIEAGLRKREPRMHVEIVPHLEKRLQVVQDLVRASGATHLVLGLCSERGSTAHLQAHARRAGQARDGISRESAREREAILAATPQPSRPLYALISGVSRRSLSVDTALCCPARMSPLRGGVSAQRA